MKKKCPNCNSLSGVREYIYGVLGEESDPSKYVNGGNSIFDDEPDYRCIKCATDFYKNSDEWHNKFISNTLDGISFQCKDCKEWFAAKDGKASHKCKPLASP